MCLAIPGKIIKIEGETATIEYPGETREAMLIEDNFNVGDYVFVSEKIVIEKIPEEEALASLKAWENVKA
ncbi:HypC/HybG/HupF family hydrogenase formation chaperone [Candidatus Woesearchaeota archaeon]|nr:HypC/HybG/HupF family hydrogenase formation chaperone [Candidatus Woesearchaeota archaeon]